MKQITTLDNAFEGEQVSCNIMDIFLLHAEIRI